MIRPARGTLAWRLYALGLVQLVLLAIAVMGVGWLIRRTPPDDAPSPPGPPPYEMPDHRELGPAPGPPHGPPHGHPPHERPSAVGPLVTFFLSGLVIVGIGSFLTARWIVVPLDRLSRTARAIGAGDLAARTGLDRDDELGELGRAFDDMAARVQALLLAEKELMANVSHELRTPLARIRVALDLAGEGDADAGRVSMTEIATDLAELEALIDDVLTATRLAHNEGTASRFEMHVEEIGPDVLASRASERFRSRHPRRSLTVTTADALPRVRVDPVLFRRVIDNLLENAEKYSPDPARPIALRVAAHERVAFEVTDEGLGIPPEDLPHVFTPFFRGERSRFRGTGGVGLGLTLAKRIVEAHGGSIDVQSTLGKGTTVRVTLPRAEA
jgi:two-component system OmpR family sensor kinase